LIHKTLILWPINIQETNKDCISGVIFRVELKVIISTMNAL